MGPAMTANQAIIQAIQENFHQIMNADPQEKRRLIDAIFDYETIQQEVAEAMAELELEA
jgi:DNA repair exonuclease SbcCD ATPase subunit